MSKLVPLPAGMRGAAFFSNEVPPQYRHLVSRWWTPNGKPSRRFLMWIGQNPSDGGASMNDPTISKECKFTKAFGYDTYVKLNVMDRIATKPAQLLKCRGLQCSMENIERIMSFAGKADKVVCCWGALHASLQPHATAVERVLREAGIPLYCVLLNAGGTPAHPLYVLDSATLQSYEANRKL